MTPRSTRLHTAMAVRRVAKKSAPTQKVVPTATRIVNPVMPTPVSIPMELNPTEQLNTKLRNGTLFEYIVFWLTTYKRGTIKQTSYDTLEKTAYTYIQNSIGPITFGRVCSDDIQRLITHMKEDEGYSYSTCKKVYDCLHAAIKHAVKRKVLSENPMELVEMPGKALFETKEVSFYGVRECSLIIEEAMRLYSNGKPVYVYGDAIILILLTGLRLGEALGLAKDDFDRERRVLKVRRNVANVRNRDEEGNLLPGRNLQLTTTKTYSGYRELPLTSQVVAAIERMIKRNPYSPYIINSSKGEMAAPEQIDRTFRRLLANIGLESAGVHKLRHTFASILFASQKTDIKTISRLLGHASPTITLMVYIHIAETIPYEAITPLDEMF